jgi:hypothetical protein
LARLVQGPPSRGRKAYVVAGFLVTIMAGAQRPGLAATGEVEFHANLKYRVEASLPGCWDESEFRRRITRRTGYDPFRENAPATVLVSVSGSAGAVGGRVDWKDANGIGMGERRFVAKDGNCGKLLAEMNFAVALQIEMLRPASKPEADVGPPPAMGSDLAHANGATGTPAPSSSTASSPPSATAVPSTATAPPETGRATAPKGEVASKPERLRQDVTAEAGPRLPPEPPASSEPPREPRPSPTDGEAPWAIWLGLGPSLAWGMSPSTMANGRLFLGIRHDALSFEVGVEASYPSENQRWQGSGFREMVIAGTAGVCEHLSVLSGCALGKAGQFRIEGLGLDEPQAPSGFLAQTGLRLAATLDLGDSWLVAGHLDGFLLLTPQTVQLNGVGVWDMPRLSAFAGIDVGARFR